MPRIHKWIDTHGGPFILVAESLLPSWRGTEGWSFETHGDDDSYYSRACDVMDWIGRIGCGEGEAYVLGGDIGSVSWITDDGLAGGYLVQWIGIDDERCIVPALQSKKFKALLHGADAEHKVLEVGDPGKLRVIQAAEIGDDILHPSLTIQLQPGTYRATSIYFETSGLMMTVRKLELQ